MASTETATERGATVSDSSWWPTRRLETARHRPSGRPTEEYADLLDMLTLDAPLPRRVVRLLGKIEAGLTPKLFSPFRFTAHRWLAP